MGKTSSQDQSALSDSCNNNASAYSIHDEGRHVQNVNPALFLCNPEMPMNASQAEISQPMMQYPYSYTDPYLGGLYAAYGPHTMIQPQVNTAAPGRVLLPGDIPEDGPIYVNAKQYQGILRRRQARAKLEAQNKLVKNRRPYLHESRHQHALNRVRGSGGRFLSTKKIPQHSDSNAPFNSSNSFHFNQQMNISASGTNMQHQYGNNHHGISSIAEGTSFSNTSFQQPDDRFGNMTGSVHYTSIVL